MSGGGSVTFYKLLLKMLRFPGRCLSNLEGVASVIKRRRKLIKSILFMNVSYSAKKRLLRYMFIEMNFLYYFLVHVDSNNATSFTHFEIFPERFREMIVLNTNTVAHFATTFVVVKTKAQRLKLTHHRCFRITTRKSFR